MSESQIVNGHWWECDAARGGECITPELCREMAHAALLQPYQRTTVPLPAPDDRRPTRRTYEVYRVADRRWWRPAYQVRFPLGEVGPNREPEYRYTVRGALRVIAADKARQRRPVREVREPVRVHEEPS